jgi:DNA-binding GntR family transcriptional regulator
MSPATPLGQRVYEALLAQLISLQIAPGSRISVDGLVRELDVSQTPIRAALIRLESEGLVLKTHNVGFSAAPLPTRARFEEIFDLRMLLEPYVAARAASRLDTAQKRQLRALAEGMASADGNDAKLAYGRFARHDADFHAWIAARGDNELAADTLGRLHAHMHLFRLRFHSRVTREAIKEHAAIVEALLAGDPQLTDAAMRSHITRSRERMAPYFGTLDESAR